MKNAFQMIKHWDIMITVLLVILSFIPISIFSFQQVKVESTNENLEYIAVISSRNEEVRRITLTGNKGTRNWIYLKLSVTLKQ